MIRKYPSPIAGHVRVVFELPSCIWADRIFLSGDFNQWNEDDIELQQNRSGVWQASLDLPVGKHFEFRYIIDGQWRTDSHVDGFTENGYGSQNSVVLAELPEEAQVEPHARLQESRTRRPVPQHHWPSGRCKRAKSKAAIWEGKQGVTEELAGV